MIFLYILLSVFLLLFLILSLSLRITFSYDGGLTLKIGVLFYNYTLLPSKKAKRNKKIKKKAEKKSSVSSNKRSVSSAASSLREFTSDMDFVDFIEVFKLFLTRLNNVFSKHLRVKIKKCHIIITDKDPSKAAILYGAVIQGVQYLFEYLRQSTKLYPIEKSNVLVKCDFDRDKSDYSLSLSVKIRLIHMLLYLIGSLFDFFKYKETIK